MVNTGVRVMLNAYNKSRSNSTQPRNKLRDFLQDYSSHDWTRAFDFRKVRKAYFDLAQKYELEGDLLRAAPQFMLPGVTISRGEYDTQHRCTICADFDLCSVCYSTVSARHPDHSFFPNSINPPRLE